MIHKQGFNFNLQVANPTSHQRQMLIVESLSQGQNKDLDAEDTYLDSVIAALGNASLDSKQLSCTCTRKCATVNCPCRKSLKLCDTNCHPKNLKCANI